MMKYHFVCTHCGYVGKPKILSRSRRMVQLAQRIPVTILRKKDASEACGWCPECQNHSMVSLKAPHGQAVEELFAVRRV